MPSKSKKGSNNQNNRAKSAQKRRIRAEQVLLPTAQAQYGTVALATSDLTGPIIRELSKFSTTGTQIYKYRQFYGAVTTSVQLANANTYGSLQFNLAGLDNASAFETLFDQYRIDCVEVTFSPLITMNVTPGIVFPRLYTVIDYDDYVAPTSLAYLRQYDSCIISPPGSGVVRTLCPASALAAYTGTFTGYANRQRQWIDIASPTAQHYGIKFAIEAALTGQTVLQSYDIDIVTYISFKSVR